MDAEIKPIVKSRSISGPAVTVEEIEGGNLMSHFALNVVMAGDIIVIDQKKIVNRAGWGAVQSYVCKKKHVAGVIIDGSVRDVKELIKIGVPVFCRGISAAGPHKGWGGNVNIPISCGGVQVSPGDIIVADDNGVVVVKLHMLRSILDLCYEREKAEKKWFKLIDSGRMTTDFMGFNKKLKEFDVEIE